MIVAAAVSAGVLAIYLLALWQPERQVRLHQKNLLRSIEKRDWERFARFLADDYSDRWGHDKEFVLSESRQVFRQFLFLNVRHEVRDVEVEGDRGMIAASITLEGTGGPLAELAEAHVNQLPGAFTFRWRHVGWQPWQWVLVEVNHPALDLPER